MHGQKLSRGWVPASQRGVGLPASLDAFFESALDPEPAKRPATAAELVTAFRKASGAWPPENDHLTAG
ncbi:MAG: hypothetical protein M0D55_10365 [Elusimicrobiota bacterium]|nr:MAG: hypothetical protein M0D55_10365 [Elusimicrobiota bacterium]